MSYSEEATGGAYIEIIYIVCMYVCIYIYIYIYIYIIYIYYIFSIFSLYLAPTSLHWKKLWM